jgi:hypothetical protein
MRRIFLLAAVLCLLAPGLALADVGISVAQSSIDFGQVEIGQSRTLQVEVSSTGTDILKVNQVQFSLDNVQVSPSYPGLLVGNLGRWFFMNSDFSNASISIPPGESRLIDFTFTPTSVGTVTGTLFIDGNFGGALPMVSYTGEGVAATYTLSPTTFDLGTLHSGDSVTRQYTVTNTSTTTDLHVSGYSYILSDFNGAGNLTSPEFPAWNYGSGFSAFRSDFSSYPIAPGGQQTFSFTYFATTVGSQSGTIELNTDGSAVGSNLIAFTVEVQELTPPLATYTLNPTAINFGTLNPGQSATGQFTITNTDATDPLNVFFIIASSLALDGFTSPEFPSVNSDAGLFKADFSQYTIAPGSHQVVTIAFNAGTLGLKSGTLEPVTDGAAWGPNTISFTANVVAPPPPPPPSAPAYVEPPPVPGVSFFWWDEGAFGRHFYVTDKLVIVKSVLWNYGDGTDSRKLSSTDSTSTAKTMNPLHLYSAAGVFTVPLTMEARLNGRDTTYVSSQVVPVGPQPVAMAPPSPEPPKMTSNRRDKNQGSKIIKSTTKAGGGKKKQPAGKVAAIENRSWGEIKHEMSEEQ